MFSRDFRNLNLKDYSYYEEPYRVSNIHFDNTPDQYILRMMVKKPYGKLLIPEELDWLTGAILHCNYNQKQFNLFENSFIYITVRNGIVKSINDDEWHVDGFSMRVPHLPEQNYIWSDIYPTEYAAQSFNIPASFDPLKHNLHWLLQEQVQQKSIQLFDKNQLTLIDPYIVHRRPIVPVGTKRNFFRVSYIPIEIEDDTCMQNLLMEKKVYNKEDIRKSLIKWTL